MADTFERGPATAEERRLEEADAYNKHWRRWGPYLSDRQWGTVREDYTYNGDVWNSLTYEDAMMKAYRWGEDGIGGISDNHGKFNMAFSFWNEQDPFIKERLFGLAGPEGNHGEDVKEWYAYLDNTPTHSYMKMLYKYPKSRFPYEELREKNNLRNRSRQEREYELLDTGVFDDDEYFDILIEYCKADTDDILCQLTVSNRGATTSPIHVLPTLFFRNTWAWEGEKETEKDSKPFIILVPQHTAEYSTISLEDSGRSFLQYCHFAAHSNDTDSKPELLFTENETNNERLYGVPNATPFVKDGVNRRVVHKDEGVVNPANTGTKCAAWYKFIVPGHSEVQVKLRFTPASGRDTKGRGEGATDFFGRETFDDVFRLRKKEADAFYAQFQPSSLTDDLKNIQRQAWAGMLWSKQFYYFVVHHWLDGDPSQPTPPPDRKKPWARNFHWRHLHVDDVLSMPDKWEYPFFCAWDTAFHAIPLALIDPWFAKRQLDRLTREWYMHPSGQMPAYEWAFSDVNPPVHAWAAWRVYKMEHRDGNNVFEGGFLGLDNIAVFNRSEALPVDGRLRQADGTGWMAFFSLYMLAIALELAQTNAAYEDIASKFFEHFLYISDALTFSSGADGRINSLWDSFRDGRVVPLRVRSMVGLIPMFAVTVLEPELIEKLPGFQRRMNWFLDHWPFAARNVSFQNTVTGELSAHNRGKGYYKHRILLSLFDRERLEKVLSRVLDPAEFLSDRGIRSLSKFHKDHPYTWWTESGEAKTVSYLPGESDSGLFGGNSNWRGPVWLATIFLIIESLQRFHYFYGDNGFSVECPTGSGVRKNLNLVADDIMHRTIRLFCRDLDGRRPYHGTEPRSDKMNFDEHFKEHVHFFEYFDGDSGRGLGASHQTGWTGLIAKMILSAGLTCEVSGRCMMEMRPPHIQKRIEERRKKNQQP
ncbi:hypothetical protein M427DRAFT_433452 [Gonapodya prolifera JEL478]|uniref:Glycosyl hydrolase family 63 C-terminal domain-containing protein n=1 Tax=Gonapodya prolifera (strain JEL478) TaxID=1344416 RepID=A0A139AT63_GONPJ|nr:hypothetical protein M427DRAFT_433452 [Gonapodya prolifera JEL478]|eukprot:KXS19926.1 hypothetical protein M427DRAFT_433452 [Gonapodya prolifera JEL478]